MRRAAELSSLRGRATAVGLALAACAGPSVRAAPVEPFAGFAGKWAGGGDVAMTDGSREKIRCSAKYSTGAGPGGLHVNVRCASDSYKVHILIDVQAKGSTFSGSWLETTRQASGDVTGQIPAPGQIQASLDGLGFGIQLAATSNGKQQAISLQSQNTDVESVKIALRRT